MFMTKVTDGYVVEVRTKNGEYLLPYGSFETATESQEDEAVEVAAGLAGKCPEKLTAGSHEIKNKVRGNFLNESLWTELSNDCFSCGSCNIVCPTCYCFDVQDEWGLGACDGKRGRKWDACLTAEFSEVSVQGGAENFRFSKGDRFRHRIMRKAAYLNDKLDGPACVGCGRCSGACTADIANPATVINRIMGM